MESSQDARLALIEESFDFARLAVCVWDESTRLIYISLTICYSLHYAWKTLDESRAKRVTSDRGDRRVVLVG